MDIHAKVRLMLILVGVVVEIFLSILGLAFYKNMPDPDHWVLPPSWPKGKLVWGRAGCRLFCWDDTPENRRRLCQYSKRFWVAFPLVLGIFFLAAVLMSDRLFEL